MPKYLSQNITQQSVEIKVACEFGSNSIYCYNSLGFVATFFKSGFLLANLPLQKVGPKYKGRKFKGNLG